MTGVESAKRKVREKVTKFFDYRSSVIHRCLNVFSASSRKKLYLSLFAQVCLNLLDLLGVAAIGLIGAMSVRGIQSGQNPKSIQTILTLTHLDGFKFQIQIAILAIFATLILIIKTWVSIIAIRRIYRFMGSQAAVISTQTFEKILDNSITYIDKISPQSILYAVTAGVSRMTLGIAGSFFTLVADVALLLIMFAALAFVNLGMTLCVAIFFGITVGFFHQYIKKKAENLGNRESDLNINSNRVILEGLETYRERYSRRTLPALVRDLNSIRVDLSSTLAEAAFLPNITKYAVETLVIIGALFISGIQFTLNDAGEAIATLSIFLGAATRIAPAIMRIQQSLLQVRNSTGAANSTLAIIEYLDDIVPQTKTSEHEEFESSNQAIELENVSFNYFDSSDLALKDISIKIRPGESVAIVGPSGGGKSTLVDLILGLITPSKGFAKVKGGDPKRVVQYSNSRIAFVPQNSSLISATLRENLLLGLPRSQFQDGELIQSLKSVGLDGEFRRQGIILDTNLRDHGIKLSGGQVQRLGIARALLTHPEILVLDEATSSLDAGSEKVISEALVDLHGKVTLIVIAHRLSTVREVDRIYYIDRGKLIAEGTFSELRKLIPDFDTQAKLMGL